MIISKSICVAANGIFHSFLWLSNIPLYICITSSLSIQTSYFITSYLVNRGNGCSPRPPRSHSPLKRANLLSSSFMVLEPEGQECSCFWEVHRITGCTELRGPLTSPPAPRQKARWSRQTCPCSSLQPCEWLFPLSNKFYWTIIGVFCFLGGERKTQNKIKKKIFNSIQIATTLFPCRPLFFLMKKKSVLSVPKLKYCKSSKNYKSVSVFLLESGVGGRCQVRSCAFCWPML